MGNRNIKAMLPSPSFCCSGVGCGSRVASASRRGGEINALDRAFCPASSNFMQLILHRKICGGKTTPVKLTVKRKKHHQICWTIIVLQLSSFWLFFFSHLFGEGRRYADAISNQSQPGCPTWCTCLEYIRKSLAYRHPLQGWLPLHLRVKMDANKTMLTWSWNGNLPQIGVKIKNIWNHLVHVTAGFGQQMFSCWNCGVRDILKRPKFPLAAILVQRKMPWSGPTPLATSQTQMLRNSEPLLGY